MQDEGKLEVLPEALQQVARARLEHPGFTLSQLAETFTPPLSKSGLSHRIKKLERLAAELQARKANTTQDE